jgi:drug/metabolite transporter (DMT)-like permease
MGVLLGVLTALSWGSSDFLGQYTARRIGTLRTTLYMQVTGFLLLSAALPWLGGWGHLADGSGWRPWALGALAGVLNIVSTLALYRSFEIGKMSVVAPISASYPAVTVLLSWFSGEHLTALRVAGIVMILCGAVTVARSEGAKAGKDAMSEAETARSKAKGAAIGFAVISGIGFGGLFWLLGNRVIPAVGYAATVWMIRLTSTVLGTAVILLARQAITYPARGRVLIWIFGMGFLDTAAFVMNNRGMQVEQVSVVSVLASLYGAVTVILAAVFLHERLTTWQWLGVAGIFAGMGAISF